MPAKKQQEGVQVPRLDLDELHVEIVGRTGLYCHKLSAKAKQELAFGGRKKTAADRNTLKHDIRSEYLESMDVDQGAFEHSHVRFSVMAFKGAMATAALEVAGMKKTQVQRLIFMPDEYVPIYGIPRMRCDVVRNSDINRTPDVRTRAYFSEWATEFKVQYAYPALKEKDVLSLLLNAGLIIGVGDFRQEKGRGAYGTFEIADSIPARLKDADAQWKAIQNPVPDNKATLDLLEMFDLKVREAR